MRRSHYLGIGTVIFIVLFTLKLTGNIDWSWWWVLAPIWLPIAIPILVMFFTAVWLTIRYWIEKLSSNET